MIRYTDRNAGPGKGSKCVSVIKHEKTAVRTSLGDCQTGHFAGLEIK